MTGGIPGTMNRRDEIARLLAECTRAPWTAVGSDATQWAVVSDGARNGKAPLVAFALKRADAELVAKAPELLAWCLEALLERTDPTRNP